MLMMLISLYFEESINNCPKCDADSWTPDMFVQLTRDKICKPVGRCLHIGNSFELVSFYACLMSGHVLLNTAQTTCLTQLSQANQTHAADKFVQRLWLLNFKA